MAVTYTGAGGLFTHLGPMIARINEYQPIGRTDLPADLLALVTAFGTTWLPHEGVAATYEGFQLDVAAWRRTLAALGDRRLTDYATVLTPLNLGGGAGVRETIEALWRDMRDNSKYVKASTCTAGSVAAAAGNSGNGTAWTTLLLDGYNAPLADSFPLAFYDGLQSQLCVPAETMVLECVADSATDGLAEGSEAWSWTGGPPYDAYDCRVEGSGQGPGLYTADEGAGLITGGSMDTWSGSTPSGWTVAAGTGYVSQDTTVYHRGTASAKITGGAPTVRLEQTLSSGLVQGRRRYHLGVAVRGSAAAPAATVRCYLSATGVASIGESQLAGASLSTTWQAIAGFGTIPSPVPSGLKLCVEVLGLPSGTNVWLDSVRLAPAVYHGGIGAAISAGSSPWVRGDRLTFTVANNQAGKFQDHFRRWHGVQLPSILVGSSQGYLLGGLPFLLMTAPTAETVPDALVA